jgi:hypothetical protein
MRFRRRVVLVDLSRPRVGLSEREVREGLRPERTLTVMPGDKPGGVLDAADDLLAAVDRFDAARGAVSADV